MDHAAVSRVEMAPSLEAEQGRLAELIAAIVQDVAELPDRTSPPDAPDAMIVTREEMTAILEARLLFRKEASA